MNLKKNMNNKPASLWCSTDRKWAKAGDKLVVDKDVTKCCCQKGNVVTVIDVSKRGDLTIKCPVFGTHEFGFAYNSCFSFIEDNNGEQTH
jgi:hypothetical protein